MIIFITALVIESILLIFGLITRSFQRKAWRNLHLVAFVMLAILFVFTALIFPDYEPIATTGPYKPETTRLALTTLNRLEEFSGNQDNRKIYVSFWYPQSSDHQETFPLVIFSHGGLGTEKSNESLFLDLASHGYVVGSIGHTYHALWTKDEKGSFTLVDKNYFKELQEEDPNVDKHQSYAYYQKWMRLRTEDINLVLNSIIENSKSGSEDVFNLVDVNRIGVIGHSLGGSAALAMPRLRNDIDMVIALESPFLFDIVGVENDEFLWLEQEFSVPVINIYSDSSWGNLSSWPQYGRNVEMIENSGDKVQNLYLPGAGHFSLTDLSLASPILVRILEGVEPKIEYGDYLRQVNQSILEFSDTFLKKE